MITQEYLKTVVHYDPETGIFTNIKPRGGLEVGQKLGAPDGRGYPQFKIKKRDYKAHRLAFLYMTGEIPEFVDHINGVRDDCRWCNLRPATWSQNQQNSALRSDNRTGVKGVGYHKRSGKFYARIRANHKIKHVGMFETLEEAAAAINAARYELHKEFARAA